MSADTTAEKRTMEFQYNSVNPFLSSVIEYIEDSKHRKVVGHSWQDVVSKGTGEINKQKILVLGEQKIVDTQEYSKVYMGSLSKFFGLSKKALVMLNYIMENIRYNEDRICLYYPDVKDKTGMVKTTMYSSIKQMLKCNMIAKASTPGCYYINPAVMFKGERITIVLDYIRDQVPSQYDIDNMQYPEEGLNEQTGEVNTNS